MNLAARHLSSCTPCTSLADERRHLLSDGFSSFGFFCAAMGCIFPWVVFLPLQIWFQPVYLRYSAGRCCQPWEGRERKKKKENIKQASRSNTVLNNTTAPLGVRVSPLKLPTQYHWWPAPLDSLSRWRGIVVEIPLLVPLIRDIKENPTKKSKGNSLKYIHSERREASSAQLVKMKKHLFSLLI